MKLECAIWKRVGVEGVWKGMERGGGVGEDGGEEAKMRNWILKNRNTMKEHP